MSEDTKRLTTEPLMQKLPYFEKRRFAVTSKFFKNLMYEVKPYYFTDVFDSEIKAWIKRKARDFCKKKREVASDYNLSFLN